ncbi:MAG: hypothetical protein QOF14_3956 [Hyphomicrobiales bacterium]|nr:hypothetical protein [Hyphomicrobiales bacterium]
MPIACPENDRNNDGLASIVSCHRAHHFFFVAIVGVEKIGTDEKEDDVVGLDMTVDLSRKVLARTNATIVPSRDNALPFEQRQLLLKLVTQSFVRV